VRTPAAPRSVIEAHENLDQINRALASGVPLRDIEVRYGISRSTLSRYAQKQASVRAAEAGETPPRPTLDVLATPKCGLMTLWNRTTWDTNEDRHAFIDLLFRTAGCLHSDNGVIDSLTAAQIASVVSYIRRRFPLIALAGTGADIKARVQETFDEAQLRWIEQHPDAEPAAAIERRLREAAHPTLYPALIQEVNATDDDDWGDDE